VGKIDLDIRTKTSVDSSPTIDVSALALPSASVSIANKDHANEINREQNRIQESLVEMLEAGSSGLLPVANVYASKLNYLQAEIHALRELVEAQKDMGLESWQGLEKALTKIESELVRELKATASDKLVESSLEFSKKIDSSLEELLVARDRFNSPKDSSSDWQKSFDRNELLKELGVSFATEQEAQEKRVQFAVEREQISDGISQLQEKITEAEKTLKQRFAALNKATGDRDYSLMDVISFSGSYDAENESDRLQIKSIQTAAQELAKLDQQMAGLSERNQSIEAALVVFSAAANIEAGRFGLANRQMLRLLEGNTENVARALPALEQACLKSAEQLDQHGQLTQRDKTIVLSTDYYSAARQAVEHKASLITDTAVAIDVMDQVQHTQTFKVLDSKPALDFFKSTPTYQGRSQSHMRSMQYMRVEYRGGDADGEAYALLLSDQAKKAWDNIPEGAQPIFLRPISSMQTTVEGGGRGGFRTVLKNEPSGYHIEDYHLGYYLNGKFYQHGQGEIDLSKHSNADWLVRQVSQARSFSLAEYHPKEEVRRWVPGENRVEKLNEQLYSIRTESGKSVEGVRLTPEVKQLLKESAPPGMTLVLKNVPDSIQLSAVDSENKMQGRTSTAVRFRRLIGDISELGVEDFAYAKIVDGDLQMQDIVQTKASTATTTETSVTLSGIRKASTVFIATPTLQGEVQDQLKDTNYAQFNISGGAHKGLSYQLLLTDQALSAWQNASGTPVLLTPVESMQFRNQTGGGRSATKSTVLLNSPDQFLVEADKVGIIKEGKLFNSKGEEINLAQYEHKDWIRKQVEHSSGFKLYRTSDEFQQYDAKQEKFIDYPRQLYSLQLHSGQWVHGIKISDEVLSEIRASGRDLGDSLVLKRIPRSVDAATKTSQGKRTLQSEPDELVLEDLAVSKKQDKKLVIEDVHALPEATQSRHSTEKLRHIDTQATRDILRALNQDEDVRYLQSGAVSTYNTLSNLQSSLEAWQKGSARDEFVNFVRSEAKPLHDFINSPETAKRIQNVEQRIAQLKQMQNRVADGELEKQIHEQIKALEQFIQVVKDPKTKNMVETLMDASKMGPDSWSHWAKK
jgi:hypothetical protein